MSAIMHRIQILIRLYQKSIFCTNNILYIDRYLQTNDASTSIYPQESVRVLASIFNYLQKEINCKPTPQEGGVNLFTNFNQAQSSIRFCGRLPREGAVNLCTELDQS